MSNDPEYFPSIEENFARFVADGGTWPTATGWHFINEVRRAADAPLAQQLGFGWMTKVIEWEWNHRTQRNEAHTSSLGERLDAMTKKRDALLSLLDRIDSDGKSLPSDIREEISEALAAGRKNGWRPT